MNFETTIEYLYFKGYCVYILRDKEYYRISLFLYKNIQVGYGLLLRKPGGNDRDTGAERALAPQKTSVL